MVYDPGPTVTILVVDDDQAVAELVRELLNDVPGWGATVVHEASAARAVFHHVRVEILVLDINMPGISGLELLALLRRDAAWRDPPIVIMTAVPEQAELQAVAAAENIRVLHKPFDVDELVEAVSEAIAQRKQRVPRHKP
jgi:DNA-binding response OmpR family regulator